MVTAPDVTGQPGEAETTLRLARPYAQRREQQRAGKKYALVVGIDSYPHLPKDRQLKNAVNDAEAVAMRLREDFGFEVKVLTNAQATAQTLRDTLASYRRTERNDSVLLFFAGHGQNTEDRTAGFVLPYDAGGDPESRQSWLGESEIVGLARSFPAQWVFLIFDACYSGSIARSTRLDIAENARADQVLQALVAGTEDQPVLDGGGGNHSIFTRALLDGLAGWAEVGQDPDAIITASELITYVKNEVPWRSRVFGHMQNPQGGSLGTSLPDDFEFRPTRPRLTAPLMRNLASSNEYARIGAASDLGMTRPGEDPGLVELKASELRNLIDNDKALVVRVQAVRSLGTLGYAGGYGSLSALLGNKSAPVEMRAAAALALSDLADNIGRGMDAAAMQSSDTSGQSATFRKEAIASLIAILDTDDQVVLEAAKSGLGRIIDAGRELIAALPEANPMERRQIIDALAALADKPPAQLMSDRSLYAQVWPPLPIVEAIWRRVYLAARRLRPQTSRLQYQAFVLALSGALGLGLAYLLGILIPRWPTIRIYGPAVFSYALLPGALGGVALAFLPSLARSMARLPTLRATAVGGLLGGLCLGGGAALPNWFLGLGGSLVAWLIPGFIFGPLLGLGLVYLYTEPLWSRIGRMGSIRLGKGTMLSTVGLLINTVLGGVSFLFVHSLSWFSYFSVEPLWIEPLFWGIGGAILGALLTIGWAISLRQPSGAEAQPVHIATESA